MQRVKPVTIRVKRPSRDPGFTLFEIVVALCALVILYMVADRRVNEMPAAAERTSYTTVLNQLRTAVNLQMATALANERGHELLEMEGTNPMRFLLEAPSNYRGELTEVNDMVDRRGAWYFETATGDLVYVVGAASIEDVWFEVQGRRINPGQIRLRLKNLYSGEQAGAQPSSDTAGSWLGLTLQENYQYRWESQEDAISLN